MDLQFRVRLARRGRRVAGCLAGLGAMAALGGSAAAEVPKWEAQDLAEERGLTLYEATQRLELQQRMPELEGEAEQALGDRFGGIWIDPADGVPRVGVVEGDTGPDVEERSFDDSDVPALTVPVRYSYAELEEAADWLSRELAEDDSDLPLGSGIATNRNVVVLETPRLVPATKTQQWIITEARKRFGAMVEVGFYEGKPTLRACDYPFCDPPLRGGVRILDPWVQPRCTGGLVTRGRGPNNHLFLMTAGHCAEEGTWYTRTANRTSRAYGPFHSAVYGANGDAGLIRVMDNGYWNARSWVYVTYSAGETTENQSYRIRSDAPSYLGLRVCTTGGSYGRSDCGEVTLVATSFLTHGNHVRASFCGIPGDSGAPMYAGNTAYGIHVGGYGYCDSAYMAIQPAENFLNVDVTHAND